MKNHILITGASGYVGRATFEAAVRAGHQVTGTFHKAQPHDLTGGAWVSLDLMERERTSQLIDRLKPAAIIHLAAAWATAAEADGVIAEGTQTIAESARRVGARLVHVSTDVLFDGEHAPYRETDPPAPLTFYGHAKAKAEDAIAAAASDYVIVRTSLVTCFSPPDPRTAEIVRTLRMAQGLAEAADGAPAGPPVTLFTDEYRCPLLVQDLAAAVVELTEHPYRGILHVAGPERLSRYEIGQRVASFLGLGMDGIVPGTVAASGLIRPRDCTLDTSLARAILCTRLRPLPGAIVLHEV